jgi:hypothetical protein
MMAGRPRVVFDGTLCLQAAISSGGPAAACMLGRDGEKPAGFGSGCDERRVHRINPIESSYFNLKPAIPLGGSLGRVVGKPAKRLQRVASRAGLKDNAVFHGLPALLGGENLRISARTSSAGIPFPARISSTATRRASISSARSATSKSF